MRIPATGGTLVTDEETDRDRPSDDSKMVKPNCTITLYHVELLDNIYEKGPYASRSEALRDAITLLDESMEDDPSPFWAEIESLLINLTSEVKDLREDVDELKNGSGPLQEPHTPDSARAQSNEPIEASSDGDSVEELADSAYEYLLAEDQATVKEIASALNESPLEVRKALDILLDEGYVSQNDTSPHPTYHTN